MDKRFRGGWKKKTPFNCLTFLDPRNVDLYALEEDVYQKVVDDISRYLLNPILGSCLHFILTRDTIYMSDRIQTSVARVEAEPEATTSTATDRRAELMKRKLQGHTSTTHHVNSSDGGGFHARLESEIQKYRSTSPIDSTQNPLKWWKDNQVNYPLLAKYVKANAAFQATSVASERIFNIDKLVYDDRRKKLDVERSSGLVIAQDFLKRRTNPAEFRLCHECPAPQSQKKGQPKYKINCEEHNAQ